MLEKIAVPRELFSFIFRFNISCFYSHLMSTQISAVFNRFKLQDFFQENVIALEFLMSCENYISSLTHPSSASMVRLSTAVGYLRKKYMLTAFLSSVITSHKHRFTSVLSLEYTLTFYENIYLLQNLENFLFD